MAQLMFPNIVDSANAGVDRGNQMNFNRLAGLYIGDPSNNSMLLGQAAQINPGAALGIQNAVQQNQQASVQAQQQQQQAQLQKIGGAARYMASALQSNNPSQVDGAWQNVRPFLEQITGKQTPPTWDPSMEPALYNVIAQTSQAFPNDNKLNVLNAGAKLVNGQGQTIASAPFKPQNPQLSNGYQIVTGADGIAHYVPVTAAGSQTPGNATMNGPNGAVKFDFAPGTPQSVIDAAYASARAEGDLPLNEAAPTGGQSLAQLEQAGKGANKPPSGYRFTSAGDLEPIPGGPADKSQSMAGLGDPSLSGQDYLQSIQDPGLRNLISAIADGREQVPRIYRSGKAGEIGPTQIAAAVSQFDPTFNAQDFNSRNRTRISFTSGPDAKNMMNLNQAAAHAQQLVQQIPNLAGHFLPFGLSDPLNSAINNASQGGTAALKTWNTTADALAHEVRGVFAGSSGGTLEELNRNLQTLNGNDPVSSKQAALQSLGRLLQSRIGLLQEKYQQGMGKAGDPFATTYPEASNVLNALSNSDPSTIGYGALKSAQPAVAAPGASPIDALISKYGVK